MEQLTSYRFRGDGNRTARLTATEAIEWLKAHRHVWYQAPMDSGPRRLYLTSQVKTWARNPNRFSVGVEYYDSGERVRFRIDEGHLDRIRIPNNPWHHGITATVQHEHDLLWDGRTGYIGHDTRGSYKRQPQRWDGSKLVPVSIIRTGVVLNQSNGYHLRMYDLSHAINHCKRGNMRLTVHYGKRTRVLVTERPMDGDVE